MLIGTYFREKRLGKGLSEAELASRIRPDFQESLIWDFESGDDNDIDGMSIRDFKLYCKTLDIEPSEYAEIPVSDLKELPLSSLIKTRREELGYSISDLSDYIGFEKIVIQAIEEDRDDDVIALNAIKQLALVLGLPLRILLAKL
jgi:transcriptional regulator with XRE-family HTH domain